MLQKNIAVAPSNLSKTLAASTKISNLHHKTLILGSLFCRDFELDEDPTKTSKEMRASHDQMMALQYHPKGAPSRDI